MFFSFFSLVFFLFLSKTHALFGLFSVHCQFTFPDGHEVVFLEQVYLNKLLMGQYNSTTGVVVCVGYTEETKPIANYINKNKHLLDRQKKNEEELKSLIPLFIQEALKSLKFIKPYVRLTSVKDPGSEHPAMLRCSVYNFYPKQIRVTWLRNEKEVTSDVTSTEELSNGNWLYQIHSYLEYTPTFGEKITCMVEHISLMEPIRKNWEPLSESDWNKISVGTAGLLFGLGFTTVGLIYYMKNTRGRLLVPTG
ncbi:LOW QUALITY PROTEIN: HLA class II histocompatibility antigen, DR beta 4 chain-like [Sphaeramia orbicularis]|uniref:LOW QUALITY PROTEIN: HLA class II histocompatibility antigen, DR beta 4 chain-like n=1 Tax=Sphaeramia orbicularis TaxID=375764 RepID=UPI00117C1DDF|nr:LOW QUALITY PROTEIN: HLA class II histocompatibility antigen, DR beta 4 chain-like [Sphaeramia orbicularis]